MAAASLGMPRALFSHTSARLFLRGNKPHKFAFSPFAAPYNSSAVKLAVNVEATAKLPRPETLPWQKELANTVHLIGFVRKPVQIKITRTGKNYAWTSLAVKLSPNATESTWFQLGFWEEMAEIAAEHVKERDQVYVSGRLNIDEVTDKDNKPRTFFQVVVSKLNFVELNPSSSPHEDVNTSSSISGSKTPMNALGTEKLWQAFFVDPSEWWDNRKNKKNPRGPDFKHKSTGEVLWIDNYSNPSWVKSQLAILDEGMKFSQQLANPQKSLSSFEDRDFHLF